MVHAPVVVISRAGRASVPEAALDGLGVRFVQRQDAPDAATAVRLLRDVEVLASTNICLPVLDEALLSRLPRLRNLVLYATGYEHIDLALLERHGITLSVLPEYATPAVAEHALAMLFSLAARVHLAHDRSRGAVHAETSLRGVELGGRTLGIIGTGRIGTHLARLAAGIGMRVLGTDVDPVAAERAGHQGIEMLAPEALLERSDAVALCASTLRGAGPVLDVSALMTLRAGVLVVNVGRPALVDTAAMMVAVRAGWVRGYGVDEVVLGKGSPAGDLDLLQQGRVLQTGHSAWWRDEVLARGAEMFAASIVAASEGRPINVVGGAPVQEALVGAGS